MLDAIGHVCWWGLTPSVNLCSYCCCKKGPKKILLVGASDIRHILETMCNTDEEVEIYVIETNLEQYCRVMLLLTVALQPQNNMGLQEKTELYLDLFGNSLLRSNSMQYVRRNVPAFIKLITNDDFLEKELSFLDLSLLKFKERDFMEGIFKFWGGNNPFEIEKLWDTRVRRHLGDRYDNTRNVFDVDYSLKLKERALLLDFNEYANWRLKGIAFDVRDGVYDTPNRTLCSGIISMVNGENRLIRGYWGDIVTSPYIAHGVFSKLKSMYEVRNRINVRTSSEVSEYNVMGLIYQICTGKRYTEPPKPDRFTLAAATQKQKAELCEVIEEEEEDLVGENVDLLSKSIDNVSINTTKRKKLDMDLMKPCNNVKVKFLPLGITQQLPDKAAFQRSFDLLYFGVSLVSLFTPRMTELLKDEGNVLIENVKYVAPLSKDQESQYIEKIKDYGVQAKCELLGVIDKSNNNFHFSFKRKDEL